MVKPFLSCSTVSLTPAIAIGRRRRAGIIVLATILMGLWHQNVQFRPKVLGVQSAQPQIAKSLFVFIKTPRSARDYESDVSVMKGICVHTRSPLNVHLFKKLHFNLFAFASFKEFQDRFNFVKGFKVKNFKVIVCEKNSLPKARILLVYIYPCL